MAIPNIKEKDIVKAMKYIDEEGVPVQNRSTKYDLVAEDGKKYPVKYIIAIANHLANGAEISTNGFNAVEAKNTYRHKGLQSKQNRKNMN